MGGEGVPVWEVVGLGEGSSTFTVEILPVERQNIVTLSVWLRGHRGRFTQLATLTEVDLLPLRGGAPLQSEGRTGGGNTANCSCRKEWETVSLTTLT